MEVNSGIGVDDCRLPPLEDNVKVWVLLLGSSYSQNCELLPLPSARRNVHILYQRAGDFHLYWLTEEARKTSHFILNVGCSIRILSPGGEICTSEGAVTTG
jgi:hypothetical protein